VLINFVKGIGLKTWAYIALAFSFLGVVIKAFSLGKQSERVKGLEKTIEVVKERDANETEVDTLDDDAVNDRLRDNGWLRD